MTSPKHPPHVTAPFRGKLDLDLALVDLVQITCLSGKSGKLVIRSQNRVGTVFINDGRIVAAEAGDRHGEDALFEMAIWPSGEFMFASTDVDMEQQVRTDTNTLLIEAARIHDEAGRAGLSSAAMQKAFGDGGPPSELSPLQHAYAEFLHEREVYEGTQPDSGTRRKPRGPSKPTPWFGIIFIILMVAAGVGVTIYLILKGP
ncbi:MAG: DUF4388 domain-containing protein [Verrucomicrobiae bacterium]|nr:DUF4388 domain-containing protein [Verrucomicrobiae bacterium]